VATPTQALDIGAARSARFELGTEQHFSLGSSSTFGIEAPGTAGEWLPVIHEGRVGIGTAMPQAQLDVRGTIRAEDLQIDGKATIRGIGCSGFAHADQFSTSGEYRIFA
jgi:hypothetical protein